MPRWALDQPELGAGGEGRGADRAGPPPGIKGAPLRCAFPLRGNGLRPPLTPGPWRPLRGLLRAARRPPARGAPRPSPPAVATVTARLRVG